MESTLCYVFKELPTIVQVDVQTRVDRGAEVADVVRSYIQ